MPASKQAMPTSRKLTPLNVNRESETS